MRKLFTIILLLISVNVFAQSWENTGTANLQRLPTAKGYFYRNNMLTKGFANWYTSPQVDSLFVAKTSTGIFVDLTTNQTINGIKTFGNTIKTNGNINFVGNNTVSAPGAWLFNSDDYYNFSRQGIGDAFRIAVNSGANFNESLFALRMNVAPTNPLDGVRLTDLSIYSKYKTVATYALMIADGTPTQMITYKVLNDENKSLTNTIYQWWPDGIRKYLTTTTD